MPISPFPPKFLRQPLVPVVPTRISPNTCNLSVIVGKSVNVPMPTLPSGMMIMFISPSFEPSGVVPKIKAGALRRVGPVLCREHAHARADVAEVGRAVAGRAEAPQLVTKLHRTRSRSGSARRPQHDVGFSAA